MAQRVENLPALWETWVRSLSQEDPLEEGMVTHSSILAWRIPWTEEPGGLQFTWLLRVRLSYKDWATNTFTFLWTWGALSLLVISILGDRDLKSHQNETRAPITHASYGFLKLAYFLWCWGLPQESCIFTWLFLETHSELILPYNHNTEPLHWFQDSRTD